MHHWVHRGREVALVMPFLAGAEFRLCFGHPSGVVATTTFQFQWLYVHWLCWYTDELMYFVHVLQGERVVHMLNKVCIILIESVSIHATINFIAYDGVTG